MVGRFVNGLKYPAAVLTTVGTFWCHWHVLSGPGSRSSSTSSLSSIASGAPPTPTSPRRRLASEPQDNTTKTPLRDQQQANNQVNSGTNSSSSAVSRLQPLRKNALPGEFRQHLSVIGPSTPPAILSGLFFSLNVREFKMNETVVLYVLIFMFLGRNREDGR